MKDCLQALAKIPASAYLKEYPLRKAAEAPATPTEEDVPPAAPAATDRSDVSSGSPSSTLGLAIGLMLAATALALTCVALAVLRWRRKSKTGKAFESGSRTVTAKARTHARRLRTVHMHAYHTEHV